MRLKSLKYQTQDANSNFSGLIGSIFSPFLFDKRTQDYRLINILLIDLSIFIDSLIQGTVLLDFDSLCPYNLNMFKANLCVYKNLSLSVGHFWDAKVYQFSRKHMVRVLVSTLRPNSGSQYGLTVALTAFSSSIGGFPNSCGLLSGWNLVISGWWWPSLPFSGNSHHPFNRSS